MLAVQSARSALCKCHLHISCANIRLSTRLAQCLKLSRFKLVHCLTLQGKWACQPWDYLFTIIYKLRVFLITNVPKLFIHCPCNVCPLTETKAMSIFACSNCMAACHCYCHCQGTNDLHQSQTEETQRVSLFVQHDLEGYSVWPTWYRSFNVSLTIYCLSNNI